MSPRVTRHGYTTIAVIGILVLMGTALLLLTDSSRDLLAQTRRAEAIAAARNVQASALAWAALNAPRLAESSADRPAVLDITAFAGPGATLRVSPAGPGAVRAAVSIPVLGHPLKVEAVHSLNPGTRFTPAPGLQE